ncbi:MAG TPA: VWA domain-containing protein [Candidatus Acidoferrales bacterium]|nr:VWA domain-containing protein [Candidatus Acidoferrales bacterium]
MIRFLHPEWFWLLAFLPLLAFLLGRRGRVAAVQYSNTRTLREIAGETRSRAGRWLTLLSLAALALIVAGLARPQWGRKETSVQASGVDIVVALDLSGSMNTPDYIVNGQRVSRFDMAKSVLTKFVSERPNDRIGLVVFAKDAYIASPLTLDHEFLRQNIDRLQIGTINSDATAIGDGLTTALNRLRGLKSKSKVVVLMTDGGNNSGRIDPLMATEAAKALGVKIYTIGLGNPEIVESLGLPADYLPDDATLQEIARKTGGVFYRAENSEKLQAIYDNIDRLEKTTHTLKKFASQGELFGWAVVPALGLLGLSLGLQQTRFRRLP